MDFNFQLEELDVDSCPFIVMTDADLQDENARLNKKYEVVNTNKDSIKCEKGNDAHMIEIFLNPIKIEPSSSGYNTAGDLNYDSNKTKDNFSNQSAIKLEKSMIPQGRGGGKLEGTTKSNLDMESMEDNNINLDIGLRGACPIEREDHIEFKGKHVIIKQEDDYNYENGCIKFGNGAVNNLEIKDHSCSVEGCDIEVKKEDILNKKKLVENSNYLLNDPLKIGANNSMHMTLQAFKSKSPSKNGTAARKFDTLTKVKKNSRISCKCISKISENSRLKSAKFKHSAECRFKTPDKLCAICSMKFKNDFNLKRHMVTHSSVKYQCDKCKFKTSHLPNLNRHKKIHAKLFEYQCELCDYNCVQGSSLQRHMRSRHTREKPFECAHCEYKCSRRDMINNHIKVRHLN